MLTRSSASKKSDSETESINSSTTCPDPEIATPVRKRSRQGNDSAALESTLSMPQATTTTTPPNTANTRKIPKLKIVKTASPADTSFRNFRLRRIVKENHGHDINQLAFFFNLSNYEAPVGTQYKKNFNKLGHVERNVRDTSNILASVGDIQANIYDNEHCGDHLDIMSNFALGEKADLATSELLTCCWLHRDDDALLAIAGNTHAIYVVSLTLSTTLRTMQGHNGMLVITRISICIITDIQKHPKDDIHLLSASQDASVRLWNVDNGTCLYAFEVKASVVTLLAVESKASSKTRAVVKIPVKKTELRRNNVRYNIRVELSLHTKHEIMRILEILRVQEKEIM
ncbi:12388_t:CDS:2 [Acaulospora colombiana]|uniref:12388_t:CDS:1 n=1 Tax=Acaulospora colombiana TaxID=27376 RepID=A0ACA9KWZ0_9GLOM|nr:12388_t:CDS:2 [Acaulospora colombiana]